MGFKATTVLVALVAAAPYLLELATRKEYPIPASNGGVVVTGASTGIGAHAAITLAQQGFLVFAGVRKEADGQNLLAEAPTIVPLILDVTKKDTIDAALEQVQGTLATRGLPLVGLVNNAGVAGGTTPVEFLSLDAMRALFDVNLFGAIAVTQAFLPLLRQSKGRVINISSMAGVLSAPLMANYCASKHALEAFSDSLRVELVRGIVFCAGGGACLAFLSCIPLLTLSYPYSTFTQAAHECSVSVVEPAYVQVNVLVWACQSLSLACLVTSLGMASPFTFNSSSSPTHPPTHTHTHIQSAIFGKMGAMREAIQERAGPKIMALYGHLYASEAYNAQCVAKASPPTVTSEAIHHALTSRYPPTRIVVANIDGTSAKAFGWLLWLLNDRLRDKAILATLKKDVK